MGHRRFLVTGASRGIGRAIADALGADGHEVVGLARHPDGSFPGELHQVDLADAAALEAVLAGLAEEHFDGLVNNVGSVHPAALEDVEWASLEAAMWLNLGTALALTQAVLPGLRAQGWGRIVNISSVSALGIVERTSYVAAKSALIGVTRTWALELATSGVTVNAVAPGPIETELYVATNPPGSASAARHLASVPMLRLGKPSEVAAAVRFLVSDSASFITGQTIFVDGGASIGKLTL
jgi:NAD(P)-dependent dehydrogenase (short-subunit alcohol dehydrogenase family)